MNRTINHAFTRPPLLCNKHVDERYRLFMIFWSDYVLDTVMNKNNLAIIIIKYMQKYELPIHAKTVDFEKKWYDADNG